MLIRHVEIKSHSHLGLVLNGESWPLRHFWRYCNSSLLLRLGILVSGMYGCPATLPSPKILALSTLYQRSDKVNTSEAEEAVGVPEENLVGIFEFCPSGGLIGLLFAIFNHQGIFNVRNVHTGPPSFSSLSERTRCQILPTIGPGAWIIRKKNLHNSGIEPTTFGFRSRHLSL